MKSVIRELSVKVRTGIRKFSKGQWSTSGLVRVRKVTISGPEGQGMGETTEHRKSIRQDYMAEAVPSVK